MRGGKCWKTEMRKRAIMASRPARAGFMEAWAVAKALWEKWGRPTFHRAPRVAPDLLEVGAHAVSPLLAEACGPRARGLLSGPWVPGYPSPSAMTQGTTHGKDHQEGLWRVSRARFLTRHSSTEAPCPGDKKAAKLQQHLQGPREALSEVAS